MAERSYRGLLWSLVLVGLTLDQFSKYEVFRWLYQHPQWYDESRRSGAYEIVPGAFKLLAQFTDQRDAEGSRLTPLRTWSADVLPKVNHGALFGLAGEYETYANTVFAVVSVVAAMAIGFWSTRRSASRDWALCAALGLILGGTLGNLYDRLIFNGVRDFLYFYWIEWPVFNVADCCLVCGAFLLLGQAFWGQQASPRQEADQPALAATAAEAK
jgi:lipoprotein signal peptidase